MNRREPIVIVKLRIEEGWRGLVDEVDARAHRVGGLAGIAHDHRREGGDAGALQARGAVAVSRRRRLLVHSLQHHGIARLDAEKHRQAPGLPHQVERLVVGVRAAEERHPFEVELVADHHPQQALEARQRHVESVVDEADVPHAALAQSAKLALERLDGAGRVLARHRRVVAEGARVRTASRGPQGHRRSDQVRIQRRPVDRLVIEIVRLGRSPRPMPLATDGPHDVGNAAEIPSRAVTKRAEDRGQRRLALRVDDAEIRAE